MRTLLTTTFILFVLFSAPHFAVAQNSGGCSSAGPACTITRTNDGTCAQSPDSGFYYCRPNVLGPINTAPGTGPTNIPSQGITLVNPLGAGVGLMELLNKILAFVIQIGTIVVIFMLVYVGYLFVVAQGEPAKITAARQALLWTVVGALILLGSQAIAFGIQATVQALSVGK